MKTLVKKSTWRAAWLLLPIFLFGARLAAARPLRVTDPGELDRIQRALPAKAFAAPAKPRRLLVFCRNVGYPGHASIPYAATAFQLMGRKTGAYETVISEDPALFQPARLRRFDAVFLNNTVGNLFTNRALRAALLDFVVGGGGLLGLHGTSVAFTRWPGAIEDWPEFGLMLGARGANHRENNEHVFIRVEEPAHPISRVLGRPSFDYRDEFFRVHDPYSRRHLRALLSIDTARTDMNQGRAFGNVLRADNDYALAWIKRYGRGRVFYCTIGHHPAVFCDPMMLRLYLAAIQFALGDLPAPAAPSAIRSPFTDAQERLGWRIIPHIPQRGKETLWDSVNRAAQSGLLAVGCRSGQFVGGPIPKRLGPELSEADRSRIRMELNARGLQLAVYELPEPPAEVRTLESSLALARALGAETVRLPENGKLDFRGATAAAARFGLRLSFRPSEDAPEAAQNLWRKIRRAFPEGSQIDTASPAKAAGLDLVLNLSMARICGSLAAPAAIIRLPKQPSNPIVRRALRRILRPQPGQTKAAGFIELPLPAAVSDAQPGKEEIRSLEILRKLFIEENR